MPETERKSKIERKDWTAPDKKVYPVIALKFEDGFEVFFRYDFNRICDLEAETGLNLGVGLREISAQQSRALITAYLRTAHAVTLDEVGDLLTRDRNRMLEAVNFAMAEAGLIEPEPSKPAPNDSEPQAA